VERGKCRVDAGDEFVAEHGREDLAIDLGHPNEELVDLVMFGREVSVRVPQSGSDSPTADLALSLPALTNQFVDHPSRRLPLARLGHETQSGVLTPGMPASRTRARR
jgi:hypothetical protein